MTAHAERTAAARAGRAPLCCASARRAGEGKRERWQLGRVPPAARGRAPPQGPARPRARRYFTAEGCELRIGAYESLSTLCIYLESDAGGAPGAPGERNHWVKSRIAVVNQRRPERTEWKESAICTKTWNNSVLQVMRVRG
jgi:hypothetical protein